MKIYIVQYSIDEVSYLLDYIKNNIASYKLSELTNNRSGDVPTINSAHPLAMEYGAALNSSGENYTSIFPAIGVELVSDNDNPQMTLGRNYKTEEITQAFITALQAMPLKSRWSQGFIISDSSLSDLQAAYTAKFSAGEKLYATTSTDLQSQSLNVSIWSNDFTITRTTYLIVKSLLKRFKDSGSNIGLKNVRITGQNSLYNFDFSETLFGAEFGIELVQMHKDIIVDTDIRTIKTVKEYAKDLPINKVQAGLTAKSIHEEITHG